MIARITEDEIATVEELVMEMQGLFGEEATFNYSQCRRDKLRNLAGRVRNICYVRKAEIKMKRRTRASF